MSSEFEINSDLRQKDGLSPTLFHLVLKKLKRDSCENRKFKVIGEETFLAYADDIVILENSRQEVTQFIYKLIESRKNMELCTNEEKTLFMMLSRKNVDQSKLRVGKLSLKEIYNFKYLGININKSNTMHWEINERISNKNKYYYSVNK